MKAQPDRGTVWDPGGTTRNTLVKIHVPITFYTLLSTVSVVDTDEEMQQDEDERDDDLSRTKLDSHANMPVVGRHSYVISDTGRIADVSPFTPDYDSMKIKIVDAAIQYDCPYQGTPHILVVRNALYVPSMRNNLLPPFILRQVGIEVNDVPKIHVNDPSERDHSIYFKETDFWIPLALWGTFSYFPSCKPTVEEMQASDNIYLLTPSQFNPHDDAYAANEDSMLDWEGNMVERGQRSQILLSEVVESPVMALEAKISSVEFIENDRVLETQDNLCETVEPCFEVGPNASNEVASVLVGISPIFDDCALYNRMKTRAEIGRFQMSVGSTNTTRSVYLVEDDDTVETEPSTDD